MVSLALASSALAVPRRWLAMIALAGGAALTLSAAEPAWAGVDRWTEIGQEGSSLSAIAFDPGDPSRLYAAGASGAFVSSNRGERWHRLRTGLRLGYVSLLQTVSGEPGLLYATRGGLLRSTDGGLSWESVTGAPTGSYFDLVTAAGEPASLFALIRLPGDLDPGLFRSRDGGEQWQRLFERVDCFFCGVEVDPFDPATVYLWSRNGLLRSLDGGDFWTEVTGDLLTAEQRISELALAPSLAGTLYALVDGPGRTRLRVSRDGAASWSEPGALPFVSCQRLSLHASDDVVFSSCGDGTVYRSDDGGAGWAPAVGLAGLSAMATDPVDGSRLHAVWRSEPGLLSSQDGGRSWRPAGRGINAASVTVTLAPNDPLTLYAADGCELLFSQDGGTHWERRAGPTDCATRIEVQAVAIDRRLTLYASIPATPYAVTAPLYRSRDGGLGWTRLGTFPGGLLTPHPTDPRILLAGRLGIHRSEDGGATWHEVLAGRQGSEGRSPHNIFFGAGDPPAAYATVVHSITGSADTYLWISHDAGETWELTDPRTLLAVVPGEPDELYELPSFPPTAYPYSPDGGQTWREIEVPGEGLVVVPSQPPTLYTGGDETALVSHDRGETWSSVPGWTELLPTTGFAPYVVHPLAPESLIYPGAAGLFRATFADAEPLALHGGRIEVRSAWRDRHGPLGAGRPRPISDHNGAFWFFRPNNLELAVKALDGRPVNERFWSFATPLTTLEHEVTLLDTATGQDVTWQGRAGDPRSTADLRSLVELLPAGDPLPAGGQVAAVEEPATAAGGSCSGPTLCLLGGRFRVTVTWRDGSGGSGIGAPMPLTPTSGAFSFFRPDNLEVAIKILDGRPVNGHFWVFLGRLGNVDHQVTVTDTVTGKIIIYARPPGGTRNPVDITGFRG